jgi:phage-related minor tail protein
MQRKEMITIELFRLFGSIFVDNSEANRSIANTDSRARDVGTTFSDVIKKAGLWAAGLATAAGGLAVTVGTIAFNAAEDLQKSLNGLQASTGAGTEKMAGMRDAMLDIYNNNFGKSFEDIGLAMQTISQQTKQSGDELANTTKNALTMRDTFGIEVNESIRSVNQLMKNFGVDSNTAYNLMAQGAQSGLNANENLADTINEYSIHFSQLGLNSQDMFNMLSNGAASGVFDIDKLGDSVKEFGIRVKDGSKGTTEAFQTLGLDANKVASDFAAGGEKGKAAFELVTTKLNEIKDPLKQNTVGVSLFGTMFEDVGAKGIAALTSTKGSIDKNVDALGKINAVKYDTFTEALAGIGRQLETGILVPIGNKILPLLNEFAKWIQDNMPLIIAKFKEVAEKVVKFKDDTIALMDKLTFLFAGIAAGAATFGIYTLAINSALIALKLYTISTTIATGVTTAFGAVLAFITSPIGGVVLAIGGLVAAGVWLYKNWDTVKIFLENTWTSIKDTSVMVFNSILDFFKEYGLLILGIITGPVGWAVLLVSAIIKNWDTIKTKTIEIFESIKIWIGEKLTAIKEIFINSVESFKQAGKDIFTGVWDGIKGIWNNISSWVSEKVSWLADKLSFWKSSSSQMSSGGGSSIQARASGGTVNAGQTYLVGEKGIELFTPSQSGTIIPNNRLSSASGTQININITGNSLMNESDADRLGDLLVRRLKSLGVN